MPNPLNCTEQKSMTVQYQVKVTEEGQEDFKVCNTAVADSRENNPGSVKQRQRSYGLLWKS